MYCADVLPSPGRPFAGVFTYEVPAELVARIAVGCQVVAPLGARDVPGFVVRLHDEPQLRPLKLLRKVLRDVPSLPPPLIRLAEWMSEYYLCSLGEALQPVLPPGSPRLSRRARLTAPADSEIARRLAREHPQCAAAIRLLREGDGEASVRRLEREVGAAAVRRLRDAGVLEVVAPIRARRPHAATMVELVRPAREVREAVDSLRRRAPKQAAVLEALLSAAAPAEVNRLASRSQTTAEVIRALATKGLVRLTRRLLRRAPWEDAEVLEQAAPTLTADQARAVCALTAALESHRGEMAGPTAAVAAGEAGLATRLPQAFLLHGVTASGKTEVFLRAIERTLQLGRQAIVLMPEISLTAQAVGIFRGRFGAQVAVMHSALSPGERADEWRRIHAGEANIVIGARSAVFAPCPRLGLIVLDEEHDPSYKQDSSPRYHAREAALQRARLENAVVVLAGATPSVESFHRARSGEFALLSLVGRIGDRPAPAVEVLDLRGGRHRYATRPGARSALPTASRRAGSPQVGRPREVGAATAAGGLAAVAARRETIFTPRLIYCMKQALDGGEQIILFLNRRGYATVVLCPECGEVARCPHCNVALVFHRARRAVECHHCGLSDAGPTTCPRCGGASIEFAGYGTERVADELARLLPQARPTRMDRDTAGRKGAVLRIVEDFRHAEADVLVGTQMVTKGFHFPGVTLVGVLSADVALNLPDFRAGERTFQLLAQVAGRCGRGDKPGRVIIQTYAPDHYAIAASRAHDYEAFFADEIQARREHGYPPFSHLCNVIVSAPTEPAARAHAEVLALACTDAAVEGVEIMGPARAPLSRLRGRSRWHLLLKAPGAQGIHDALRHGLAAARAPAGVIVTVDMDPVSLV
jgi:primosomal protein N' (replication factor Y)